MKIVAYAFKNRSAARAARQKTCGSERKAREWLRKEMGVKRLPPSQWGSDCGVPDPKTREFIFLFEPQRPWGRFDVTDGDDGRLSDAPPDEEC